MKIDIFWGGGLLFKGVKRSKLHCGIMQPLVDCEGKETSGWKWIEMHRRCSSCKFANSYYWSGGDNRSKYVWIIFKHMNIFWIYAKTVLVGNIIKKCTTCSTSISLLVLFGCICMCRICICICMDRGWADVRLKPPPALHASAHMQSSARNRAGRYSCN